jgi:hypothetical protein
LWPIPGRPGIGAHLRNDDDKAADRMVTPASWRPLRGIDPARLAAAREQAHHAVQWLARAARAYSPPRPDDTHTNLGWDDAFGGFIAHPLPDGARLGLRLADLTLALFEAASEVAQDSFALDGRHDPDACNWLSAHAGARNLDPHALDAALPYMLKARAGDTYTVTALAEPLGELATWFANANAALGAIRRDLAPRGLASPPVCCWPHHFDLDTLVTVAPGRTTGVGFAPGDEHYDEPYFYASVYPAPDVATLPTLPAIGHWHAKHFTAAIAPAHRIVATMDPGGEVAAFLRAATDATIAALRRK